MNRRAFLGAAAAALLYVVATPAELAAAEVRLKELIAMTKKAKPQDMASLAWSAGEAKKLGWDSPASGKDMHWLGKWNVTTHKGEKAQFSVLKGGKIRPDNGAKIPFRRWEVLGKPGSPAMMSLSGSGNLNVYYQYYEWRNGAAVFLSNFANRAQYMTLTMRS